MFADFIYLELDIAKTIGVLILKFKFSKFIKRYFSSTIVYGDSTNRYVKDAIAICENWAEEPGTLPPILSLLHT